MKITKYLSCHRLDENISPPKMVIFQHCHVSLEGVSFWRRFSKWDDPPSPPLLSCCPSLDETIPRSPIEAWTIGTSFFRFRESSLGSIRVEGTSPGVFFWKGWMTGWWFHILKILGKLFFSGKDG